MRAAASVASVGVADLTVARARVGDAAAFADIVRAHQAMVFSIAYRFCNERPAAEDIAQDVFLRLFRHLEAIDSSAHLTYWLRKVTSRCCIDWGRKHTRAGEVALDDANEAGLLHHVTAPPLTKDVLLEERLRQYVSALPDRTRLVVTLRYQEDLDPGDIAQILDLPVNTVKSHLRRGIERLRDWIRHTETLR